MDALTLQLYTNKVGQCINATDRNNRLQLAVLNGTQQFVHSLIFTSLLEVLEKDVVSRKTFIAYISPEDNPR